MDSRIYAYDRISLAWTAPCSSKQLRNEDMEEKPTEIANFSPTRGVTKPSRIRPTVIPNQNPVAVIPLAKAPPFRTRIMKVTIHPPSATSTPTYPSKNAAHSQVTRAEGRVKSAVLSPPFLLSPPVSALACRKTAPVAFQKQVPQTMSSMAAQPT
jgi:hypothetical protein